MEEREREEEGKKDRVTNRRWYDLLDTDIAHIFEQHLIELSNRDSDDTPGIW